MSGRVIFRPARAGRDEAGIAAVHWAARRLAYRDILPRENLDGRTVEVLTREWVEILARDDGAETLVAEIAAAAGAASSFEARLRRAPQDEEFFPADSPRPHPEVRGDSRASKERTRMTEPTLEPRIVGFATGGPVRERKRPIVGDLSGVTAEVSLLYVLPEEMGKGLGRALFERAVRRLAGLGHEALVVWAYRANPYLTFYERLGGVAAAQSDWEVEGRLF
ncbi:MAG: family N-acetyltransferase, partial [Rhodospirillales bacterium]|nr:family N-acetyltransferase [Rhodospirillales bacterium]